MSNSFPQRITNAIKLNPQVVKISSLQINKQSEKPQQLGFVAERSTIWAMYTLPLLPAVATLGAKPQKCRLAPTVKHSGQESGGELCEIFKF